MTTQSHCQSLYTEGRLLLAAEAFKQARFKSIRATASAYDVPRSTLTSRLHGCVARCDSQPSNRKLTNTEEHVLRQQILSMSDRGMSPRVSVVRQMANIL